ncbi:hypothetical protein AOQ84DRAFT_329320 [Glonium stellatum]|uniref:Zn(2)-C6 fungal-type domain-containing protein n=1 Tax=Glonium stellatum TaxID=574774 RepID=A0A8E2EM61_9PEZI|nr:hypothetical protein AOQ84DRAFT_329320 [Glonium stellatum]
MVFCGKPSKACQRCRDRRLRCDLRSDSCGQCIRAGVACTGYRDTLQLRVRDESQAVQKKALLGKGVYSEPRSLTLSLESQARDVFFIYHVTEFSKTWDFLRPYYNPAGSPEHLTLSIDAVSLAYFSHQVCSDAALATARKKYILALNMTKKALQSPEVAVKDSTLLVSLLLDLFEKVINDKSRHSEAWKSHMKGALALIKLRGLRQCQGLSTLRLLARFSTNFLISCVATETRVPNEVNALRAYIGEHLEVEGPKWLLSDLMVDFANLRGDIRNGQLSPYNRTKMSVELDAKFQELTFSIPSWQYKTTTVDYDSKMIYGHHFDSYANRHVTQTWNVCRIARILLNEYILECCSEPGANAMTNAFALMRTAKDNIETLARDICASVPQYVDCFGAAQNKLPISEPTNNIFRGTEHLHSPSQNLDCYTLIFPLYVAGRSSSSPSTLKPWAIEQLCHIGSHFGIRNAELVRQELGKETNISPWAVYAMLGGYAFAT